MQTSDVQLQDWIQNFPEEDLIRQGWTPATLVDNCLRYSSSFIYKNENIAALICYYRPWIHLTEVLFLGTLPIYREKGIMSQLMDQFLLEQQGNEVWLECREDNLSARHLYLKKGFKQTGRRPNYYKDGSAAILFNY